MIKRWLPSLIGLSALALFGRLLGFAREALMASKFGASEITDAYLTTLLLFDIAVTANSSIISGTFSYLSEIKNQNNFFSSLFNVGLKIFGIVFLLAMIFYPLADKIIPLVFTRSAASTQIVVESSRLLLVLAAFISASGVFSSLLQMKGSITNPGRLIIFLNVTSITFLILFTKFFGIVALPLGLLFGGVLFFVYQIYLIKKTDSPIVHRIEQNKFNFAAWLIVVIMVYGNSLLPSVSGLIERYFAYSFAEGTFSHYQYAVKILLLPLTIFSFAISASLLPLQTKSISEGDKKEFSDATNKGVLVSVVTSCLFAVLFYVLAEPIIQLIYERGHFTHFDSSETSLALRIMSVGLIPFLLNPVIANIYFALRSLKSLIAINLFFILIQTMLLFYLSKQLSGIQALTITWVVIVWMNNFFLFYFLFRRKGFALDKIAVLKLLLVILCGSAMALIGKYFSDLWLADLTVVQNGLLVLLKTMFAIFVLLILFISLVAVVFWERMSGVVSYLKGLRK
ncbi:MAG: lipid II flippase MurJ [Bacteroidota bacterium]